VKKQSLKVNSLTNVEHRDFGDESLQWRVPPKPHVPKGILSGEVGVYPTEAEYEEPLPLVEVGVFTYDTAPGKVIY
jgi:hypothetical protein